MKTKTANSFIFAIMIVFIAIVSMPQNGYAEDKKVSTAYADGTEQHRIKGVTVEIPSIWEETKKSDTEYYFYDRQDVFWRSNFLYINILPLPEQTDTITDEIAAEILEGIKSGMTDCTVHSVTPYPSEAYSGYLYKLSGNVAFTDVNVTALIAIIDDELYQFVFTENAKTKYDYSEDVEQIFKSISPRLHYEDEYIELTIKI